MLNGQIILPGNKLDMIDSIAKIDILLKFFDGEWNVEL